MLSLSLCMPLSLWFKLPQFESEFAHYHITKDIKSADVILHSFERREPIQFGHNLCSIISLLLLLLF